MKQLNDLIELVKAFFEDTSHSENENTISDRGGSCNDNISPIFPPIKTENNNNYTERDFTINNSNENEIIRIILEFDDYIVKCNTQDAIEIAKLMQFRLMEYLITLGAEFIDKDERFNNERHIPVPLAFVQNGKTIKQYIRYGIISKGIVLLKAKVEIYKPSDE